MSCLGARPLIGNTANPIGPARLPRLIGPRDVAVGAGAGRNKNQKREEKKEQGQENGGPTHDNTRKWSEQARLLTLLEGGKRERKLIFICARRARN